MNPIWEVTPDYRGMSSDLPKNSIVWTNSNGGRITKIFDGVNKKAYQDCVREGKICGKKWGDEFLLSMWVTAAVS